MKFKSTLIGALREISSELRGLKVAIVEQNADLSYRVGIVETEQTRLERRIAEHEARHVRET